MPITTQKNMPTTVFCDGHWWMEYWEVYAVFKHLVFSFGGGGASSTVVSSFVRLAAKSVRGSL